MTILMEQTHELDGKDKQRHSKTMNKTRGVQNQTNPIEKPQAEPTQTETAKNCI